MAVWIKLIQVKSACGTCSTTTFRFVGVLHTCCTVGVVWSCLIGLCFTGLGLEIFCCCCNVCTDDVAACCTGARGGGLVTLFSDDETSGGLLGWTAR